MRATPEERDHRAASQSTQDACDPRKGRSVIEVLGSGLTARIGKKDLIMKRSYHAYSAVLILFILAVSTPATVNRTDREG